jgi:GT2 family glycosyltransferase
MNNGSSLSILTLTHNDYESIEDYFNTISDSFDGLTFDLKIYAWDCEAGFISLLEGLASKYQMNVEIIQGENVGFGSGCNILAKLSDSKFLLFLNPDTKIVSTDAERLSLELQNVGISQCAVFDSSILTFDLTFYPQEVGKKHNLVYADGCALLIRSTLFKELGGFDSNMFIFAEDLDLSIRAWLKGFNVQIIQSIVVDHKSGATVPGGKFKRFDHMPNLFRRINHEKNLVYLAFKYWPFLVLLIWFPLWILSNISSSTYFLFKRRLDLAFVPFLICRDIVKSIKIIYSERILIKKAYGNKRYLLFLKSKFFPSRIILSIVIIKDIFKSSFCKYF